MEATLFHVGWDGEAFAVHAISQTSADVRLVRLSPEGNVVTPETAVGKITSIFQDESDIRTDPDTGTTWWVSWITGGVWLSGHLRDGTPLPGTEAGGGVLIVPQGFEPGVTPGSYPAIAAHGERNLIGWYDHSGLGQNVIQHVDVTDVFGNAITLPEKSDSDTLAPFRSFNVKGSASWPPTP